MGIGVRCDNGGCMKIAGNVITGRGGVESYGVLLEKTGSLVDQNIIRGGCASMATAGVLVTDAYSRVQNNRIFGFTAVDCSANPPNVGQSYGMRIFTAAGPNEIDIHSNTIDGGGANVQCRSRAIELDVGPAPPAAGVGIFRNNILRSGSCGMARAGFIEFAPGADPRIFENNDLDPTGAPAALYIDEGGNQLTTVAGVDALLDMTVSGTLSADPLFVSFPADLHLQAGSPCAGAGTPNGAPLYDMEGDMRDPMKPSIGADEP
jgi:hypothetical protein